MQVKKINAYLDAFEVFLQKRDADRRLYIWESQKVFQEAWDIDAIDLVHMYDQSLQNSTSRRLWNRQSYAPKEMMLLFAKEFPDFFRTMFTDLFNEDKSVEGRMGRFVFYCNQLFADLLEVYPKKTWPGHYHDDGYEMISIYLSFKYPEQYCPYRLDLFQGLLKKIGGRDLPLTHDTERYFKVCRTLSKLLQKRDNILKLHQKRMANPKLFQGESLLLVYDFACFIHSSPAIDL